MTAPLAFLITASVLAPALKADSAAFTADKILAGVESASNRRYLLLREYSVTRQYNMENFRFGKQAAVTVLMNYRQPEGESYSVMARSGSDRLNGIIDRILASEAGAATPMERARHEVTVSNYRARLLGTEAVAGRRCYVLELTSRFKDRFLVIGKAWVDTGSYAMVRIEGQFADSMSVLIGTPHITEDYIEVNGLWLPGRVRSVTSSFLLGQTELDILYSNYQIDRKP